jgi:cytochrome b561
MSLTQPVKQVDKSKIWKTGLLAIVASVVANLIAFFILGAILDLPTPTEFPPLSAGAIGFLTAVFTFIGVVVFALLVRFTGKPIRNFWIVATIAFVLSIIPNITSAMNPAAAPFPFPVSSSLGFWVLIVFHVIAYLVLTFMMTTRTLAD